MSECLNCGFKELLPTYNYCPLCGKKQKKGKRPLVVNTNEPLTEDDWKTILSIPWSKWRRKDLEELKKNGNVPIEYPDHRPEGIDGVFIAKNLPYRFRHMGRHHKGESDFVYRYKIFKVRPKGVF